jgi:toxin CcdB
MQFAVYWMPRGRTGFIVDVQSRLLDDLATRVVIPLVPRTVAPRIPMKTLNPVLAFNGAAFVLMTQTMASIPVAQMGRSAGLLAAERDQIVRAIDALLSWI